MAQPSSSTSATASSVCEGRVMASFPCRARAPLSHPSRIAPVVLEALVQARRAHQHWGARKILAWLARKQPALVRPVASTVSDVFARYGLSRSRTAKRRTPPYTDPFGEADAANRIWCADFKGDCKTGDFLRCYPLTIADAFSRMLLRCKALRSTKCAGRGFRPVSRYGPLEPVPPPPPPPPTGLGPTPPVPPVETGYEEIVMTRVWAEPCVGRMVTARR